MYADNIFICMPTAYAVGVGRAEFARFDYLSRMPTTFAVGIHRTASTYAYGFCCRHCLHAAVGVFGLVCPNMTRVVYMPTTKAIGILDDDVRRT